MPPYSAEQSIFEGELGVKQLFKFVKNNSGRMDAYSMEKSIFSRLMDIGLSSMKCYFASKGTEDVDDILVLKDGTNLKKEKRIFEQNYFTIFGKLPAPQTCYRDDGHDCVMPLDAQAKLPKLCYSCLLQEWMTLFGIHNSFGEAFISLNNLLRLDIKQSRFEVVNREAEEVAQNLI